MPGSLWGGGADLQTSRECPLLSRPCAAAFGADDTLLPACLVQLPVREFVNRLVNGPVASGFAYGYLQERCRYVCAIGAAAIVRLE